MLANEVKRAASPAFAKTIDAPLPGPWPLFVPPISVTEPLAVTREFIFVDALPVVMTPEEPPIEMLRAAVLPPVFAKVFVVWFMVVVFPLFTKVEVVELHPVDVDVLSPVLTACVELPHPDDPDERAVLFVFAWVTDVALTVALPVDMTPASPPIAMFRLASLFPVFATALVVWFTVAVFWLLTLVWLLV